MAHSNQIREFKLTNHGIELLDVYVGPGGVLTGSARIITEAETMRNNCCASRISDANGFGLERKREIDGGPDRAMRSGFEAEELRR